MALETRLAAGHWDKVTNRDPVKTYTLVDLAGLAEMGPGIDWVRYLEGLGAPAPGLRRGGRPPARPRRARWPRRSPRSRSRSGATGCAWHVVHAQAPYLSAAVVEENFDFYGRTLSGRPGRCGSAGSGASAWSRRRSARRSASCTSSGTSRRTPRSGWSSSSTTSSRPSGAACRRCRGWATTPGARRWPSSASSPQDRLPRPLARLLRPRDRARATCSATSAAPWRSRSTASSRSSAGRSTATSGS